MFILKSKFAFLGESFIGKFDSVSEAISVGSFVGLPGEEFEVVDHEGTKYAGVIAPNTNLSRFNQEINERSVRELVGE